jgi:CubicO group peptidase (beta-lactamase class C family)
VPGIAAGILKNETLVWAEGIGYADLENKIAVTPNTPFRLASVSKPFAAVIIMQLVEQGKLSLETPMATFRVPARYHERQILVRHVFSHTSEGIPGESYRYSGNSYSDLTLVIEEVTGTSYPNVLRESILERAHLQRTVPGQLTPGYEAVVRDLAKPYESVGDQPVLSAYPILVPNWTESRQQNWTVVGLRTTQDSTRREILQEAYTPLYGANASSGLISTVGDLAKFDIALDRNRLITHKSKQRLFTPTVSNGGDALPYGLGWFVQKHRGTTLVWHYGNWPPIISALYLKVPEQQLTFILLSNSDRLSSPYSLGNGDVLRSPYAKLFLDHFVNAHE